MYVTKNNSINFVLEITICELKLAGTTLKTPENLRTCSLCNSNQIEDDSHFLFPCEHYNDTRNNFFDEINDLKYRNFNDLDKISKIMVFFNNVDPFVCRTIAAYIYDSMLNRQSMLV